ncbi:GNAT family N-acetyltransferase [Rhodopseudomonas palustris]|uniref:GNAT family N-acetyltransferase n=1 Tax=Rhodopseudomonas palustris TaxID=1076 RepID=A0A323UAK1_RHOPL|nr:GNAT family N-acetyltransferase [Rhodopseudomonas palustris]PZA09237.1 GNAT family N-acetyltransferase [Rhodopseudomonas palustris]
MAETFPTTPLVHRRAGAAAPTADGPGVLSGIAAIDQAAWCDLATRVVEPNGYYLRDWVIAANGDDAATRTLTAHDSIGRLIGVAPVLSCWRAFRLPLPALVSADLFRSLDTPLLDRGAADEAAAKLLAQARAAGARALVLRDVARDGEAVAAFTRVLAAQGLAPRLIRGWTRACLDATRDAEELLRDGLGAKKLKELRRLERRLGEHGEVGFTAARSADDAARAFDVFLALEDSGWKGRGGSSLKRQPELAARLRSAAVALASRGQCEVITLSAGTTPVAAGIVLRHGDRAYFFKLGIDESFARCSPGVLLTLALTRHLCADQEISFADSTASAQHPMIDPIWRGRFAVGDLVLPLRKRDPLFAPIVAVLSARDRLRHLAKRLLKR